MIKVVFEKEAFVSKIVVSGHAMHSEHGSDIVCASVSSMVIFAFNTCIKFDQSIEDNIVVDEGYLEINIKNYNVNIDTVLKVLHYELSELQEQYQEYITVNDGGESYD